MFKDVFHIYIRVLLMTTILAGIQDSLLVLRSSKTGWKAHESLMGTHPESIAFDPINPSTAYCGTFGMGIWKTEDGGQDWDKIGKDFISSPNVTSVSVSPLERGIEEGFNVVYAGTEPSEFYRSNDGGHSWERMISLNDLSSSQSWSFPPRPWTHRVRWIEPDVNSSGYIFVAIEAGALVQSRDSGRTWIDRPQQGPYDTHTLATHRKAPKRLYSSAGDGYFESFDYGKTWNSPTEGLRHHYLYGLAVDSGNPQIVIVSASLGPEEAYSAEEAESFVYRREADGKRWEIILNDLCKPNGTTITTLTSNPKADGEFYAVNNRGLFMSTDSGVTWKRLDISWSKAYLSQAPRTLAVCENK